jgi:Tol biopolymer transport system component
MFNQAVIWIVFAIVMRCPGHAQTAQRGPWLGQSPPGDRAVVFAPGVIATDKMEYRCVVSPDGREIFFCREKYIFWTRMDDAGIWSVPEPAPFSGTYIDGESCFSRDGNRIYFCSRRPMPGAKVALNIWYSEKKDGAWQPARPVGGPLKEQTAHAPSIAANGNIYASGIIRFTLREGRYSPAEKLTPSVKGAHPWIAPDESFLLFGARQGQGYASDIFVVFKDGNGRWTEPVNLGPAVNSPGKESNPSLSADGRYLFFSHNEDIYWISAAIIDRLRQERLGR